MYTEEKCYFSSDQFYSSNCACNACVCFTSVWHTFFMVEISLLSTSLSASETHSLASTTGKIMHLWSFSTLDCNNHKTLNLNVLSPTCDLLEFTVLLALKIICFLSMVFSGIAFHSNTFGLNPRVEIRGRAETASLWCWRLKVPECWSKNLTSVTAVKFMSVVSSNRLRISAANMYQ